MTEQHDTSWRAQAEFNEIVDQRLVGSVGGIDFDFTGGMIDPTQWTMSTSIAWTGLTFPWDEAFSSDAQTMASPTQDTEGPFASVLGALAEVRRIRVHPGDKVEAHDVRQFRRGGSPQLEDAHDNTEYWVKLRVTRQDGTTTNIDEDVNFAALDAMSPHSDYDTRSFDPDFEDWYEAFKITFGKIAHRIERLSKGSTVDREWMALASQMLLEARGILSDETTSMFSSRELMDIAATAGYALAKAEAEAKLEPLARSELKAQEQRARAAKAGAASRTKPDTAELKRLAADMCRTDPNLSLNRCCQVLADKFDREPANIRRLVLPLFEKRDLPGGKTEYRPRRTGSSASSTGSTGG